MATNYKPLSEEELKAMKRAAATAKFLSIPADVVGKGVNALWEFPGVMMTGKGWNQRQSDRLTREAGAQGVGGTPQTRDHNWFDGGNNYASQPGTDQFIRLPEDKQENKLTNALTKDKGIAGSEWNASFSPREERALNQVRGSVAQNRARLKRDFGTPTQETPQENKNPDFDTRTPRDPDNKNQYLKLSKRTWDSEMFNPDNPANKNVPDFGEAVEANKEGGLAQSGGQAGPTPKAMMAMAAKIFGQKGQKAPEQQVAHNPLDWNLDWQSSYSQGYW